MATGLLLLALPTTSHAQTMEDVLNQLFVFSSGGDPLFLAGSSGDPAASGHGNHFIPAAVESNGTLLGVFTSAIANNIGNFPLSSTVASQTFSFVGGVPVPTSNSFGPIFSERAQTLGTGRFDVGFSYSSINFSRIRGIPMSDIELAFIHENVDSPACDTALGGDCTDLGLPLWEHDVIDLDVNLGISAAIYAFNATFGVRDWLDIGIAVPVVSLEVDGLSVATVQVSDVNAPAHFFGGTQAEPELTASTTSTGRTTGVGDIATRMKVRMLDGDQSDLALLGEVRVPTGRVEDFLGSGETSVRGMLIASSTLGDFSPHLNFGYINRKGDRRSSAIQFAGGFDQRLSDWATFVIDLLGEFKTEDSLAFPEGVVFDPPLARTVPVANIPNIRDDVLDASIGFKVRSEGGVVLFGNALIALNNGGMRAGVVSTLGFQYSTR